MPPSRGKAKTRAARRGAGAPPTEAHHEPSDIDTPEAIATPSRVSRKRARGTDAPAPAARNTRRKTKDTRNLEREDTEGTEPQDASDDGTEPALPSEVEIVASLKVAERQTNATEDFANDLLEGQENVPGYGKIAGRDWAFIIRKVEVNIGRPEAHERLPVEEAGGQAGTPSHKTVVDIDLGPDRQVSRSHAIISYDGTAGGWFIVVNGRNGLHVDNNLLKRGAKSFLRNGSVIEIAGTQMAFITTPNNEGDGPVWDASIIRQAQKSSEEDDDGYDDSRINGARPHAHPQHRGQLQDASRQPPQYNTQQQQQQQPRTHPHSQRAAGLHSGSVAGPPGTPLRPTTATMSKSSPSANYSRGFVTESADNIEYSVDSAKDLKPPQSYAQLIGVAILSAPEEQMTLNNIYKHIMANYAFYRFNTGGWQNSIRHNLSLNKAFTKIARRTDEPGKGMKWMIEPTERETFVTVGLKGCRRPAVQIRMDGLQSSAASPSSPLHAGRNPPSSSMGIKRRDDDTTPPLPHFQPPYPRSTEAFTPDRGSRRRNMEGPNMGLGINEPIVDAAGQETAYNLDYLRSTPRNGLTAAAHAAGSPPSLYVNDEGRVGPMDTPFPLRPTARFAPPSTLRRPSDFIQFSSPAPFWKMEGLVGSTPFKPYDMSPLKTPFPMLKPKIENAEEEDDKKAIIEAGQEDLYKDREEEKDVSTGETAGIKSPTSADDGAKPIIEEKPSRRQSPIIPSSSPPRQMSEGRFAGAESPSIARPGTSSSKGLSLLAAATNEAEKLTESSDSGAAEVPSTAPGSFSHGLPDSHPLAAPPQLRPSPMITTGLGGMNHNESHGGYQQLPPPPPPASHQHQHQHQPQSQQHAYPGMNAGAQDDDDEGIDLAKGFQPIGSYHQHNHMSMSMHNMGNSHPLGVGVGTPASRTGSFGR